MLVAAGFSLRGGAKTGETPEDIYLALFSEFDY